MSASRYDMKSNRRPIAGPRRRVAIQLGEAADMATQEELAEAWGEVKDAAKWYAQDSGNRDAIQALLDASCRYAKLKAGGAPKSRGGPVIPFGRSKGKALGECDTEDLKWVAGALTRSIEDLSKARFKTENETLRDAIQAEIASR